MVFQELHTHVEIDLRVSSNVHFCEAEYCMSPINTLFEVTVLCL